jgi:hypothetical protein
MRFLALAAVGMMLTMPLVARDEDPVGSGLVAGLRPEAMAQIPKTDQDRVLAAYHKALADNPELKKEGDDLVRGNQLEDSSPAGQAAMEKGRSYRVKVRQAMLKEDPTLSPVLAEIDKHVSALKAQHQSEADAARP